MSLRHSLRGVDGSRAGARGLFASLLSKGSLGGVRVGNVGTLRLESGR